MWKDPDGAPLMWFGLLFSILGLACHFRAKSGEELPDLLTSRQWQTIIEIEQRSAS